MHATQRPSPRQPHHQMSGISGLRDCCHVSLGRWSLDSSDARESTGQAFRLESLNYQ